jgi:hypothetical protein
MVTSLAVRTLHPAAAEQIGFPHQGTVGMSLLEQYKRHKTSALLRVDEFEFFYERCGMFEVKEFNVE